ncbi:cyclin-D3-1 isoform X2 [Helianthus annuus]|uniref:cyclin-D3-1 isoform X2 n=1 Tax=Helianthus annuus TaxID=4232 RepID=UPI000B8F947B|nr:cyclin-D3-1 isoform X2 [Helianthus annuus]
MTRSLHYEFLWQCEWILLSVINDMRFQGFLPSVMSIVSQEIEPDNALDYRNQLMNILNISEVRDVLGDGRLIKRHIRDGKGYLLLRFPSE